MIFSTLVSLSISALSVSATTRSWVDGGVNDCQYVELNTFFGAPVNFALGPGICYSFYFPSPSGSLLASSFDATCSSDPGTVIIRDFGSADCDPSTILGEYDISVGTGTATIWQASLGGLPATLASLNCASSNRDCYLVSEQQYFDGPCDPFGTKGSDPFALGTIPQINGYCYANPLAGISQIADCDAQEIRFYGNLNCDDTGGELFINTFDEYAFCAAEGPSAQNGGFNESSIFTCTEMGAPQYIGVREKMNFGDASDYCEDEYGTELASITSEADNIAVTQAALFGGIPLDEVVWIGLSRDTANGQGFDEFTDGTTLGYTNFHVFDSVIPSTSVKDCGALNQQRNDEWVPRQCSSELFFVCNGQ